jgi:hypothetical protein
MAAAVRAKARIAATSPTGAQRPGRASRAEIRTMHFAISLSETLKNGGNFRPEKALGPCFILSQYPTALLWG